MRVSALVVPTAVQNNPSTLVGFKYNTTCILYTRVVRNIRHFGFFRPLVLVATRSDPMMVGTLVFTTRPSSVRSELWKHMRTAH